MAYLAFAKRVRVGIPLTAVSLVVLGVFYIHTSWMVVYAHGDIRFFPQWEKTLRAMAAR